MPEIPVIPENAPFNTEQRLWLNGFLAGYFARMATPAIAASPASPVRSAEPLLVMFGSQTGTAEGLAKRVAKEAQQRGFAPRVLALNDYEQANLAATSKAVIISSTWGEGDPPDNAVNFWSWLNADPAPRLEHLQFAVLGLGDKNYSDFCGASKKFDSRLETLGAKRLTPRGECDVDYEATANGWIEGLWDKLGNNSGQASYVFRGALPSSGVTASKARSVSEKSGALEQVELAALEDGRTPLNAHQAASLPQGATDNGETNSGVSSSGAGRRLALGYSKANPFPAALLKNVLLTKPCSAKEVRHYEIDLEGSGLVYEVGDALGVMPMNCLDLVNDLLAALGCKGDEMISLNEAHLPLREALTRHLDVTKPSQELLAAVAQCAPACELAPLLAPEARDGLKKWLWGRGVIDLLHLLPEPMPVTDFVIFLRKLMPRLYSISSSPKAHPDEVHLTVSAVRYESHGLARKGVASTFLADRVGDGDFVKVFVQPSPGFKPPTNGDTPIIMIGPGTGIAPFRAFLEERQASGAKGKNWLFFGDQKYDADFLYEKQLTVWLKNGHLSRLDLAFSRDQAEKIYVQHRMIEHAAELWSWLEAGAHFYVCGDASRMAKDVDAALHTIIEKAGGQSAADAKAYVAKLKAEKRYQRDVY